MKKKILIEFHGWTAHYCVYYFFLKALKKKYNNINIDAFATFPNLFNISLYRRYLNFFLFLLGSFLNVRSFKKFKLLGTNRIFMPLIKHRYKFLAEKFYKKNKLKLTKNNLTDLRIDNILIGDLIYDTFLKVYNLPTLNIDSKVFINFFINYVSLYYYWKNYFKNNSVKTVIVVHASYFTGLPLRISTFKGIKSICGSNDSVYSLNKKRIYAFQNYLDYKKIFKSLKNKEHIRALSKKNLMDRVKGKIFNLDSHSSAWNNSKSNLRIKNQDIRKKTRVLITTHLFSDTPHVYGKLLFPDAYAWLIFLLKLSKKTNYLWFIKVHPDIEELAFDNSFSIIKDLLKSYPHIVLLDPHTSHHYIINDLKVNAVLTIYGSVAHEYPYFNIPVINASSNNPHINNKFCINPKSIKELKKIILKIPKLKFKADKSELIDFYYMHKIYFDKSWIGIDLRKFIEKNNGLKKLNEDKQIDIKLLNYIKNHDKIIHKARVFLDSDSYYLN
tara:strand:+ start:3765 stop:5261 length:1497 start_codon:yes stop_codon:yes gene_type:complete